MLHPIHIKRLKREKKLKGRMICHGNKFACFAEHLDKPKETPKVEIHAEYTNNTSWKRFKIWLKKIFYGKKAK